MTANADQPHIGMVVEGPGDVLAAPLIFRSIANHLAEYADIFGKPVSCNGRSNATKQGGIERLVQVATSRPGCKCLLVILDSDQDAVCVLGPSLVERLSPNSRVPLFVTLLERNWEDMIYASAETLELDLTFDPRRRGINEIKGAMGDEKYVKPTHQPRLTARVDVSLVQSRNASAARMIEQIKKALVILKE